MNRFLKLTFLLLLIGTHLQANKIDDGEKDKKPQPATTRKQIKVSATAVLKQEAINALNSQLKGLNFSQSINFVPNARFLAESNASAVVIDQRDQAKTLFDYLQQNDKMVTDDGKEKALDMTTLPIGISKKVGPNNTVIVGFSRILMKPNYAELTAFVKMEMMVEDGDTKTKKLKEIFFGAEGIKMTNHGKIVGEARLVLLGDYTIPMFHGKMKLVMRGGSMSKTTGALLGSDKTFAVIDCNGFKEAGIEADAIFDRSVMKPIDKIKGDSLKGEVVATLKINGGLKNFNDILGTLDFKTGFAITGHEKWGFVVQNMFFDASTERNHGAFQYVNEYLAKHNEEIAVLGIETWRGVGLDNFQIMLPREFKKKMK
jgi:hypothetical protein